MATEAHTGLSVWGGGQLLAFSGLDGPTDYEHGIVARTAKDGRAAVEIMLPASAVLVFDEAAPIDTDITGDTLWVRSAAGESTLVCADAHHLLVDGPCRLELPDGGPMPEVLSTAQSDGRTLVGTASAFDESWLDADPGALWSQRRAWLASTVERLAGPPAHGGPTAAEPAGGHHGPAAVLRKALSVMKTQVCSPEGILRHRWTTPDRWPHRKIWLWDSAFHAVGWRHVDVALAREMLAAVVDTQRPDGRIPISTDPFGRQTGEFTQPPVLALAAALVDEAAGDDAWLASLYEPLVRYVEWDLANRDSDGFGLVEWAIEGDPGCRSGESGADNSSRFDAATQLDAPDFNALLAHELEHLAAFADRLGRDEDAGRLRERHREICARINDRLWDEAAGIYMDAHAATGERTGVFSCAGFLPLLCGAPSPGQAASLVAHLREPEDLRPSAAGPHDRRERARRVREGHVARSGLGEHQLARRAGAPALRVRGRGGRARGSDHDGDRGAVRKARLHLRVLRRRERRGPACAPAQGIVQPGRMDPPGDSRLRVERDALRGLGGERGARLRRASAGHGLRRGLVLLHVVPVVLDSQPRPVGHVDVAFLIDAVEPGDLDVLVDGRLGVAHDRMHPDVLVVVRGRAPVGPGTARWFTVGLPPRTRPRAPTSIPIRSRSLRRAA